MPSWTRWLIVSVVVIVLDQLTKNAISNAMQLGDSTRIMPFFNLVLAHNTGAAFSLFANAGGWQRIFFAAIAIIASAIILHLLRKNNRDQVFSLSLALILGGAIGNLIDRILLGYVVDFVQLHAGGYYWPAFNVADSAITMGAALLVWDSFRRPSLRQGAKQRP